MLVPSAILARFTRCKIQQRSRFHSERSSFFSIVFIQVVVFTLPFFITTLIFSVMFHVNLQNCLLASGFSYKSQDNAVQMLPKCKSRNIIIRVLHEMCGPKRVKTKKKRRRLLKVPFSLTSCSSTWRLLSNFNRFQKTS